MDLGRNISAAQIFRLIQAGNFADAELHARSLVNRNRRDATARSLLGQALAMKGDYKDAAAQFEACLKLAPKDLDTHLLLAEAYTNQGNYRQAAAQFDRALRLNANCLPALAGKGDILHREGASDKARTLFQPIVDAGAEDMGVALVYARVATTLGEPEAAIDVLARHRSDTSANKELCRAVHHQLGQLCDRLGRYDEAFAAFTAGNDLNVAIPWDPVEASAAIDRRLEAFSAERLARLPRASHGSQLPVFIVGLMRSGSTLCEQIIDAHPRATGAGEVMYLYEIVRDLPVHIGSVNPFPACVAELTQRDLDSLAESYLSKLSKHGHAFDRICDKYLGNFAELGLISILFPQARVIHTRRNPLDTCLSCFSHRFPRGVPAWSERLDDLGHYYNDYLHIMHHWRQTLDIAMLEIDYEELVTDQQAVTRRIIDFCGLEWNDACLRPHETGRKVMTLSREQVSKPMYRSSVERWRNYEEHLGPLIEILQSGVRGDGTIRAGA